MIEELLAFILGGGMTFFFVVRPVYRFIRAVVPQRRDSLEEAKERLEIARKEAAAAKLNKQAEELYEKMYKETLEDESSENNDETINNNRSTR